MHHSKRSSARTRTRSGFALAEVLIAGVMLAIGLAAILTVSARSLSLQTGGEKRMTAAWLTDELLNMVLVEGPEEYSRLYDASGGFAPPFSEYQYEVEIDQLGRGLPYRVIARVWWNNRAQDLIEVETLIAQRLGDPEQPREPYEPVDREERWYEKNAQH